MRVLIIGGTGLISTGLVAQLLERQEDVTLLNRGRRATSAPPGVRHLACDRTDAAAFESVVRDSGTWDCVVDMVCFEPEEAAGAVRAFSGRVGQYVMTSTVDVYRKPATRYPYREEEPFGGIGHYAEAKVACEQILWTAHRDESFPLTVIRPAATYGDGHPVVNPLGFRPTFVDRLRKGKSVVVHGDGSSFWVSCHRDDVAGAFLGAIGNGGTIGRAFHATGEEWVTWDQHIATIARAIGAPEPDLVHIPSDVLRRIAPEAGRLAWENFRFNNIFDNSAARTELNFEYRIRLEDGFARSVAWLDAHGRIADSDADPLDDRIIATWRALADRAEAELAPLDPQTT